MSVKVVTDTSCDLPVGVEQEFDITVVPLIFVFGDEQFKDKTMSMTEFWEKAQTVWPKSAAPSAGDFERAFRTAVDAGHQVICITVTSKLSATYNAAHIASQHFSPDQVAVVDSATLAVGQGHLVLAAARASHAGQNLAEVMKTVEAQRNQQHLYITLDTVQYLVKGGRASKLSGILAGLLKIRPLLNMQDGELALIEKPRGRQIAKQRLL
ncbi:MAG: DegV family protein, partial [Anaerolineae bacterium]|nr:DegV family protein [Anaerolineae bacterium]